MKKSSGFCVVATSAAILVVALLAIIWLNSYSLTLLSNGFNIAETSVIWVGIDDNGHDYRVVQDYVSGQNVRLAYLTKGSVGLWGVTQVADKPATETEMVQLGWMNVAGIKSFDISHEPVTEWETHAVYCGNNAIKQMSFPVGRLPSNVTVSILQVGEAYTLHFVSFGEAGALNNIDTTLIFAN